MHYKRNPAFFNLLLRYVKLLLKEFKQKRSFYSLSVESGFHSKPDLAELRIKSISISG